jgi:hypothetical protein
MEELMENLGLILGATTFGAYFANIFRLRHHIKSFLAYIAIFITTLLAKKKKNGKAGDAKELSA